MSQVSLASMLSRFSKLGTAAKIAVLVAGYHLLRRIYNVVTAKSLRGEVALVTGAGNGIGALLARQLALQHGVVVAVWDLDQKAAMSVAAEICQAGGKAKAWACDVTDRELVKKLAVEVKQELGVVTLLVNNAGIVSGKKILDVPDGLAQKTFEVNCISHIWMLKAFLPDMLAANHGHVVTVASQAGQIGVAGLVDYCASKFGAVGLDESLRMELRKSGKTGVKTTCVCPYYINTGMFDGVKSRFPFSLLIYIMEPQYVVDNMISAIRTNQALIMLPPGCYLGGIMRAVLPTAAFDAVTDLMGINSSMDDFKGDSKSFDRTKA